MVTIKGLVVPAKWDERGNVVAVAIATHDEEEYLVGDKEKGMELLELTHRQVEVVGDVENQDGRKVVRVRRYGLTKIWDQWSFD